MYALHRVEQLFAVSSMFVLYHVEQLFVVYVCIDIVHLTCIVDACIVDIYVECMACM